MTYLALGIALAANLATIMLVGLIARLQRQNDRARDLMLNQMLNLAGRPWQPPPSFEALDFGTGSTDEAFEDVDQVLP